MNQSEFVRPFIFAMLAAIMPGAAAIAADDLGDYRIEAATVSKHLMEDLSAELVREMKAGGPPAAIGVCTEAAPRIAGELSREHGWKVTRVGTRVRNPLLGMPDAWEQEVLAQFAARIGAGEAIADVDHAEIVSESDGRYFRYMRAIGVRDPCLVCHGPDAGIPAAVKAMLSEKYPHDEARGYRAGDLRGAVSIKRPLKD
ncbi:MAG: DUF3365 domain-containing protein [Gammaproteobacteria bacterium]|nr:DUF3365 domain-containing protein [Gammaproteobacteria bacterium]